MSSYNTRVVRRTNSLLGHAYGTRLAYREVIPTGRGPAGCLRAYGLLAALGAGMLALMTPWLRGPLSRIIPAPGEGPKDIDAGGFTITHHGRGTDGSQHTTRVRAEGDPGYKTTAMMLAEAAVVLATQPDGLPDAAGVLTPVTALGQPYLAALREHGMEFTVLGDTQDTQNT